MLALTTRELAAVIWLAVVLVWALTNRGVRESAKRVIGAILSQWVLLFLALTSAYALAEVLFLSWAGIWSQELLKETLLWYGLTAVATAGRALTARDGISYTEAVTDSFRVVVVVQFFVGLVPFSLVTELALIPIGAVVGLGLGLGESRGLKPEATRVLRSIQSLIGFLILGGAMWNAADLYRTLANRAGLISFILPPLLSLLFLPVVFAGALYARYEWLFAKLRGTGRFRLWARLRLLRMLGLRPTAVLEFGRKYAFDLPLAQDREAFFAMLAAPSWQERLDRDVAEG